MGANGSNVLSDFQRGRARTRQSLGNSSPPNPATYPAPDYARAKFEDDVYLDGASAERGFKVVFLRPSVVYSRDGGGMVGTLVGLARRGIALRIYPRNAHHHLCDMDLIATVIRRAVGLHDLPNLTSLVVVNPYTVTNRELESMITR